MWTKVQVKMRRDRYKTVVLPPACTLHVQIPFASTQFHLSALFLCTTKILNKNVTMTQRKSRKGHTRKFMAPVARIPCLLVLPPSISPTHLLPSTTLHQPTWLAYTLEQRYKKRNKNKKKDRIKKCKPENLLQQKHATATGQTLTRKLWPWKAKKAQ